MSIKIYYNNESGLGFPVGIDPSAPGSNILLKKKLYNVNVVPQIADDTQFPLVSCASNGAKELFVWYAGAVNTLRMDLGELIGGHYTRTAVDVSALPIGLRALEKQGSVAGQGSSITDDASTNTPVYDTANNEFVFLAYQAGAGIFNTTWSSPYLVRVNPTTAVATAVAVILDGSVPFANLMLRGCDFLMSGGVPYLVGHNTIVAGPPQLLFKINLNTNVASAVVLSTNANFAIVAWGILPSNGKAAFIHSDSTIPTGSSHLKKITLVDVNAGVVSTSAAIDMKADIVPKAQAALTAWNPTAYPTPALYSSLFFNLGGESFHRIRKLVEVNGYSGKMILPIRVSFNVDNNSQVGSLLLLDTVSSTVVDSGVVKTRPPSESVIFHPAQAFYFSNLPERVVCNASGSVIIFTTDHVVSGGVKRRTVQATFNGAALSIGADSTSINATPWSSIGGNIGPFGTGNWLSPAINLSGGYLVFPHTMGRGDPFATASGNNDYFKDPSLFYINTRTVDVLEANYDDFAKNPTVSLPALRMDAVYSALFIPPESSTVNPFSVTLMVQTPIGGKFNGVLPPHNYMINIPNLQSDEDSGQSNSVRKGMLFPVATTAIPSMPPASPLAAPGVVIHFEEESE